MINSGLLLNDGTIEDIIAYERADIIKDNFTFGKVDFVKSTSKKKPLLLERPIFLDTETSHNHDREDPIGWVYQWAMKVNNNYYIGRTCSDLVFILDQVANEYELNSDNNQKAVIYVHNLGYDLTYLLDWFIQYWGEPIKYLAIRTHKILQMEFESFILRDSYLLANRSLDKWSKDHNTRHRKAVGYVDYSVTRYSDSELTSNDWIYQLSDVAAMSDAWDAESEGFNIQTVPLTSTGFVRHDARTEFKKNPKNWLDFQRTKLNVKTYTALHESFAGGLSHGNRFFIEKTVRASEVGEMGHGDFRSFYPSTEYVDDFPVGKFFTMYDAAKHSMKYSCTIEQVSKWAKKYCMCITILLHNIELRDKKCSCPCLSVDKCRKKSAPGTSFVRDNGRVLKMEGSTIITVTDEDLRWIVKQYKVKKYKILTVYASERGQLPDYLKNVINKYFHDKTFYKELMKEAEEADDIANAIEYAITLTKRKNKLNGIYGMTATNPIRDNYVINFTTGEYEIEECQDIEAALDKFYHSRNNFMRYQFGVFTTSNTRSRLLTIIEEVIGYDNFLYCDTDSIFYIKTPDNVRKLEEWNKRNYEHRVANNEYIISDHSKKIVEYMTFEDECEHITEFKFLHSKCYGYITDNDPSTLKLVVAGVSPYYREDNYIEDKSKRRRREQELGGLDNFEPGFTFTHCGGVDVVYTHHDPEIIEIDGHVQEVASACIIYDGVKTLHPADSVTDYESFEEMEV